MEKFEELINSPTPVLIDFYAEWCGPCRQMKSVLEELKRLKNDRIRIAKIDVDTHEELATQQQIRSIPTLMLFKNGQLLWRKSGARTLAELKKMIEPYE